MVAAEAEHAFPIFNVVAQAPSFICSGHLCWHRWHEQVVALLTPFSHANYDRHPAGFIPHIDCHPDVRALFCVGEPSDFQFAKCELEYEDGVSTKLFELDVDGSWSEIRREVSQTTRSHKAGQCANVER